MRIFNNQSKLWFILIVVMTLLIWINSSLNADLSSNQSGFLTDIVFNVLSIFKINIVYEELSTWIRTGAHFGEFYVLGILWGYYFKANHIDIKYLIFAVLITACLDEFIQIFSEGRAFEIFDIGIDALGGIFSLLYFKVAYRL